MLRQLIRVPVVVLGTGLVLAGTLAAAGPSASAAAKTRVVVIPYNSKGWKHRQVKSDSLPDFYKPGYNTSSWRVGQEGFGTTDRVCPWNNPKYVKTHWTPLTDMLIRHTFALPLAAARRVRIVGTIDNDATVYLNGHQLQYVTSGSCQALAIGVTAPAKYLKAVNLLAIRGHDDGDATYLNVTVTYTKVSAG